MHSELLEYKASPTGAGHTNRALTRSLDATKEGLAMNASHEQWLPVVGYESIYEVSDRGRVRSIDRTITRSGHQHRLRGRILTPLKNGKYGYLRVNLGRAQSKYIHRLVAEAFIGPANDKEVDHRDGDTSNNELANLRYVNHAENMVLQRERKPHCKRGHLFDDRLTSNGRRECRVCRANREKGRVRDRSKKGITRQRPQEPA